VRSYIKFKLLPLSFDIKFSLNVAERSRDQVEDLSEETHDVIINTSILIMSEQCHNYF
jgi:hypothetical protein